MAIRQGSNHISTQRIRIAQLTRRNPERALTALNHYIDLAWLYEAYNLTRKDGAVGIDGVTAKEEDARRVQNVLYRRFGKYGLEIHSEKRDWCECSPRAAVKEIPRQAANVRA